MFYRLTRIAEHVCYHRSISKVSKGHEPSNTCGAREEKQNGGQTFPRIRRRIFCRLLRHQIENKRHMTAEMSGTATLFPHKNFNRLVTGRRVSFKQLTHTTPIRIFFVLIAGDKKKWRKAVVSVTRLGHGRQMIVTKSCNFFFNFFCGEVHGRAD